MKGLGEGMREFKKASRAEDVTEKTTLEADKPE
jgi:Sec-independent protein translocase protein TatA